MTRPASSVALTVWTVAWSVSCGGQALQAQPPPPLAPAASTVVPPPPAVLGPRPDPGMQATFLPPAPVVFTATSGITVWLLERHDAPVVSCDITVPTGAASDPPGKGGVAYTTAAMLDEGAGKRGAIDLARASDGLGASVGTSTNADSSTVSLTVLTRHLHEAFAIFGDVVARPRLDAGEFKRVKELWAGELLERSKDPDATARVVFRAALFGRDHPYGHPIAPRWCAPETSLAPRSSRCSTRCSARGKPRRRQRLRPSFLRRRRDRGRGWFWSIDRTHRSRSSPSSDPASLRPAPTCRLSGV